MTEPLSQHQRNAAHASAAPPAEDLPRYPEASDDTARAPDREAPPGAPRWVKVFGIIAVVLVLLLAGLHVTGNAPTHMPGSSGSEHGTQAP